MDERVEGQAPEQLRRAVAEPVRREGVAELVDREADEEEDRHGDERGGIEVQSEHGNSGCGRGSRIW